MTNQIRLTQNIYPGLFLVFEGIDFCGKSTQVIRMRNWLGAHLGIDKVLETKEPTKSRFGLQIRKILGDKDLFLATDPFDLQELFAKDGRLHMEGEIIPRLERGHVVCSDRWRTSMVYGVTRGNLIELHMLMEMNELSLREYFVCPDKTFIFDISPEMAIERGKTSGRPFDQMEKLETLTAVDENYILLANEYPEFNCVFIDARRSVEEIFVDVRKIVEESLRAKGLKLS